MWSSVELPPTIRPLFPDRCAGCGCDAPQKTFLVGCSPAVLIFNLRTPILEKAPACDACLLMLRKNAWFLFFGALLAGIGTLLVIAELLAELNLPAQPFWVGILILVGMGAGCLLPMLLLAHCFPPRPIEIWSLGGQRHYLFKDEGYAEEFRAINVQAANGG